MPGIVSRLPAVEGPQACDTKEAAEGPPVTILGNNSFILHVAVQSVLQIDVELKEPETSENPTQSFEIHYIFRRRTQLLAVIIYSI